MTLDDVLQDIHPLDDELVSYERKYNVLSKTFYEGYLNGQEPRDDARVQDWMAWASAYRLWLRRCELYRAAIAQLRAGSDSMSTIIGKTARHDAIVVPA